MSISTMNSMLAPPHQVSVVVVAGPVGDDDPLCQVLHVQHDQGAFTRIIRACHHDVFQYGQLPVIEDDVGETRHEHACTLPVVPLLPVVVHVHVRDQLAPRHEHLTPAQTPVPYADAHREVRECIDSLFTKFPSHVFRVVARHHPNGTPQVHEQV